MLGFGPISGAPISAVPVVSVSVAVSGMDALVLADFPGALAVAAPADMLASTGTSLLAASGSTFDSAAAADDAFLAGTLGSSDSSASLREALALLGDLIDGDESALADGPVSLSVQATPDGVMLVDSGAGDLAASGPADAGTVADSAALVGSVTDSDAGGLSNGPVSMAAAGVTGSGLLAETPALAGSLSDADSAILADANPVACTLASRVDAAALADTSTLAGSLFVVDVSSSTDASLLAGDCADAEGCGLADDVPAALSCGQSDALDLTHGAATLAGLVVDTDTFPVSDLPLLTAAVAHEDVLSADAAALLAIPLATGDSAALDDAHGLLDGTLFSLDAGNLADAAALAAALDDSADCSLLDAPILAIPLADADATLLADSPVFAGFLADTDTPTVREGFTAAATLDADDAALIADLAVSCAISSGDVLGSDDTAFLALNLDGADAGSLAEQTIVVMLLVRVDAGLLLDQPAPIGFATSDSGRFGDGLGAGWVARAGDTVGLSETAFASVVLVTSDGATLASDALLALSPETGVLLTLALAWSATPAPVLPWARSGAPTLAWSGTEAPMLFWQTTSAQRLSWQAPEPVVLEWSAS